jgi:hypothetical protein
MRLFSPIHDFLQFVFSEQWEYLFNSLPSFPPFGVRVIPYVYIMYHCVHILFALEVQLSVILLELCFDFTWVMCMNT